MIRKFLKTPYSDCIMESEYPRILKFTRLFSFGFLMFLSIFYLLLNTVEFFLFLTDWGLALTTLYFFLVSLNYKVKRMCKFCIFFLHTIWNLEFLVSIIFWTSLYPLSYTNDVNFILLSIPTHGFLVILLGFDIWMTKVYSRRVWLIIPCFVCLIYGLTLNLPYTIAVNPIYPGIKYTNLLTYLIFISTLIILAISNEIFYRATKFRRKEAYAKELLINKQLDILYFNLP